MAVQSDRIETEAPWRLGSRADKIFFWIALAGFPGALTSPGGTVSTALVALYGMYLMIRDRDVPDDIRSIHRYMFVCYVLVVGADIVNGGGLRNHYSISSYLTLLLLAPYAYALRRLAFTPWLVDRILLFILMFAIGVSAFQFFVLGVARPGGFQVSPVGYGMVIAMLATLLLSRALEFGDGHRLAFLVSAAAFFPVLISGSKIAIICIVVGYAFVSIAWAAENRRWRTLAAAMAVFLPIFSVAFYYTAYYRLYALYYEVSYFFINKTVINESFGHRAKQIYAGWQAFLEKPIFGHGLADRMDAIRVYEDAATASAPYIHNEYVTHMVAFGICGLAFLVLYLAFLWLLVRGATEVSYRRAGMALVLVLAVYLNADVAFSMDPMSAIVTIVFGIILCAPRKVPAPDPDTAQAVYE
ncbi:MAG: O-antigen ligase family protein [Rhizobiaceae bacterium]|nr:O-antigen ligase family protein [Rhizobiaceae bacterium]